MNKILAIDPDITESGVCIITLKENRKYEVEVNKYTFPELLETLRKVENKEDYLIALEAGYLRKSNWHIFNGKSNAFAAEIGNRTGRNHEVGRKLNETLTYYGYNVKEKLPLKKEKKVIKGKLTAVKISNERLSELMGMKVPRCNQDVRDAILLAVDALKKEGLINYKCDNIKIIKK